MTEDQTTKWVSPNASVRVRLRMLDPTMLTSPDGKRIEVNVSAVEKLIEGYENAKR
jgi:hypothetical protein